MEIPEINPRVFYNVGIACFSTIFLMGLINFFIFFGERNIFGHIGSLASLLFNLALVGFFYYLRKNQMGGSPAEYQKELNEALEDFENENK